jgi:epoxyqueuosine reductase QueG
MARRCKNGMRRDGKCRRRKCNTYITRLGYCAKAGGWYRGKTKRRKTKKRRASATGKRAQVKHFEAYLRKLAEFQLGYRKDPPLIGDDPISRRNYGRADPDDVEKLIERMQYASGYARRGLVMPAPVSPVNLPPGVYAPAHAIEGLGARRPRRRPGWLTI